MGKPYLEILADYSLIFVKLTPNSKFDKIDGIFVDEQNQQYLKIYTTAIPENNKANKQLIKIISKEFKIPKSKISLIKGDKGRFKTLKILTNLNQ